MAIYFATFSGVSVAAAQDIFEITAPAGTKVAIREILFGQYSDFGDAQAELISIQLLRGHTTTGSGGTTLTPATRTGLAVATAASAVVKANNTTVATSGSPVTLVSDTFNVAAGWTYRPLPEERIIIQPGIRLVARISLPTDAITANGTIMFEELGVDRYKAV